jgi:hypothetical protein
VAGGDRAAINVIDVVAVVSFIDFVVVVTTTGFFYIVVDVAVDD